MADTNEADAQIARIRQRLAALEAERLELQRQLEALEQRTVADGHDVPRRIDFSDAPVTNASSSAEKLALFRDLFAGRPDVFPQRWQNSRTGRSGYSLACRNEWVAGVCGKPKVKCGECAHQSFIPPDDAIIERHLRGGDGRDGDFVAGVYPLLQDGTCRFLADDFDKAGWAEDARAFLDVCHAKGISAGLERSRSGNGGHVWIFFREPVAARAARQLGAALITETMDGHPDVGFASYDLLFPSQDTMPLRGFGNRIALPLQRAAREAGNSVFVDADLRPHDDQWAFLSSLPRLSAQAVSKTVEEAERSGRVLGVRMPVEDEHADKPWKRSPSRRTEPRRIDAHVPQDVRITVADQVYVDRADLPSALVARLARLAAFQNPEFYRAQAMRLPTFGKPRIVSCAELHPRHIALPRGCLDEAVGLLETHGASVNLEDLRQDGTPLPATVSFRGALRKPQIRALEALTAHDAGVLAATTAFGKTVVGAALIAHRGRNALILVHRRELSKTMGGAVDLFPGARPETGRHHRRRQAKSHGRHRRGADTEPGANRRG